MGARRKPLSASAAVTSDEAYMALFDRLSPANRPGHFQEAWKEAWEFAKDRPGAFKGAWATGDVSEAGDRFQQYWNHRMLAGEIFVWPSGSGSYRVEVRLLPEAPRREFAGERRLSCPSGSLVITPLNELGGEGKVLLAVPPGEYRAELEYPDKEESSGSDPDFVISLQKA